MESPHPSAYGRRSRQRKGRVGGLSESSGKTHPCPRRNQPPRQNCTAPQTDPRAHNPSSRNCNRPNATFRRPAIHYHIIPDERPAAPARTNAASENRTTATGRTQSPRASGTAPQNSPRAFPRAGVFVFVCEKTRPPPVSGDGQVELYSMNVACLARQQETALPVAMDSLQARTNSSVRTASA